VSQSVPEEASGSDPNIYKAGSKQSLPSTISAAHTADTNTASTSRSWDISTNIRRSAEILGSRLGQVTINSLRGNIWKSHYTKALTQHRSLGLIGPGRITSSIIWGCDDWGITYWRSTWQITRNHESNIPVLNKNSRIVVSNGMAIFHSVRTWFLRSRLEVPDGEWSQQAQKVMR
jgi:hypothetical protein